MRLSEAIEEYRHAAQLERGHSPSTCFTYVSWLRHFARWVAEQGQPDPLVRDLTENLLRRYQFAQSARGIRPRTLRGSLNALRALFAFLHDMGAISDNSALRLRMPKLDAAQRLLVSDDDLMKLLEATEKQASDFRSVRDRSVLAVLIFCGLRRIELLDLELRHVNLEERCLLVQHGKGQKSRTVPLCQEALAALREWVGVRRQIRCDQPYLFVSPGGRRFGEETLSHMLEEVKAIAGLRGDPRIKPHSIRHAAATRLLRNGADLKSIQTWLGHSRLDTTSIYLHTDEHQVRAIADLAGFRRPGEQPSSTPPADRQPDRHTFFQQRRRIGRARQ